jgi:hypothetical protein
LQVAAAICGCRILIDDICAIVELLEMEQDDDLELDLTKKQEQIETELEDFKIETLLNGKYDAANAILTIHAGAGGTEAQDWAEMLFRMYQMYAEKRGFKTRVLDVLAPLIPSFKAEVISELILLCFLDNLIIMLLNIEAAIVTTGIIINIIKANLKLIPHIIIKINNNLKKA